MSKLDPDRVAAVLLEDADGWTEIRPGTLEVSKVGFYAFEAPETGPRYGAADDLLGVLYDGENTDTDKGD